MRRRVAARQRHDVGIQRRAVGAVGVVVAERPRLHQPDLARQPHQFGAEANELGDPLRGMLHHRTLRRLGERQPLRHQPLHAVQLGQDERRIFFRLGVVARHVDAAAVHHDLVDQAVDALADDRPRRGAIDVVDLLVVGLEAADRDPAQRGRHQGEQDHDRDDLERQ